MQFSNRWPFRVTALVALILWTAACGSSSSTAPSAPPTTDTLTGTLSATNTNTYQLNASTGGTLTITLTNLTPAIPAVGMGIGVVTNGQCSVQFTNSPFTVGTVWNASLASGGTFCVLIYDIGFLTQDTAYSITVVHPQ